MPAEDELLSAAMREFDGVQRLVRCWIRKLVARALLVVRWPAWDARLCRSSSSGSVCHAELLHDVAWMCSVADGGDGEVQGGGQVLDGRSDDVRGSASVAVA